MESDSGFGFVTPSDDLWEGPTPDPKADAEKMLQEAKPVNDDDNDDDKDKDNDDDDDDVSVDSAFAMEGGGWVNVDMALLKIVLFFFTP